ncbi:unnamed protein product [Penicillium salamii]|uniref:G-patch domain-containing protein n=1 Tax=Penicillium salamii TaxID=1612424 RepID=A0A9W4IA85_9EURO|nr:unnamed protein product [Penicillium salamii]CAG8202177.1 unnamed protein product [Penicillium salamii]CAG8244404.1 unnamed protein product [Penicillium salamii]CAG8267899.1 unnamed protein product [Penicillium salamii]CAG8378180.1 unnamed protein product [Penicillium salamii]
MASEHEYDDEDYSLPPETQRPFTSGIRRKPVPFVRSSNLDTTTTRSTSSGRNVADAYLSIVMKTAPNTSPNTPTCQSPPARAIQSAPASAEATPPPNPEVPELCTVCKLPLGTNPETPHEASLAHQVCLEHSHPPSHIDRTRTGFRYLANQGWNPDERLGLGASGREGIREPIKASMKFDTAALGTGLDKDGDPLPKKPPPPKVQKLNAKQVRKKFEEDRNRAERMRKVFNQDERILKYLGEDA